MKFFLPLAFFALAASASAVVEQPDCSTLVLDYSGLVYYKDVEVFPNPQKEHQIALAQSTKPIKQKICGITVATDTKSFSFQAKDIPTLSTAMRGYGRGWTIVPLGIGPSGYVEAAQINLSLADGILNQQVKLTGYPTNNYFNTKSLIGLKIDGGPIKPVLYNGSFRDNIIPNKAKLLELYIKDNKPLIWQKMTLDVRNSKMIFTKKATLPNQ